jgi:hypothetical protein
LKNGQKWRANSEFKQKSARKRRGPVKGKTRASIGQQQVSGVVCGARYDDKGQPAASKVDEYALPRLLENYNFILDQSEQKFNLTLASVKVETERVKISGGVEDFGL